MLNFNQLKLIIASYFLLVLPLWAQDANLIDIDNLEKLNAIRYDLDGDGTPSTGNEIAYRMAFGLGVGANNTCTGGCQGYELKTDLDFNSTSSYTSGIINTAWTSSAGWLPIGDNSNPFTATFNGNRKKISNLYIDRNVNRVGFFGEVGSSGEIHNLGIEGRIRANGAGEAGLLAGRNAGSIYACYAAGNISKEIPGSPSLGAPPNSIGGLVGNNRAAIRACYATADVMGGNRGFVLQLGGLVGGVRNSGTVSACYATGNVTGGGSASVGGLVGKVGTPGSFFGGGGTSGTVSACYATGNVVGGGIALVGGLVGDAMTSGSTITACYATGSVTGGRNARVGGLVGKNTATITASYFDKTTAILTKNGGQLTGNAILGIGDPDNDASRELNKTITQLQHPTAYNEADATPSGMVIYSAWNIDVDLGLSRGVDNGTVSGDATMDDPWAFGTSSQYPLLKVDFDRNSTATMAEFGRQLLAPKISFVSADGAIATDGATDSSPVDVVLDVVDGGFSAETMITITVDASGGTITNADYTLAVKSGSATGVSLNGAGGLTYTLTVPASTMSVTLTFTADDTDNEGEVVTLTLSNSSAPATIGTTNVHIIPITDSDTLPIDPQISFDSSDGTATDGASNSSPVDVLLNVTGAGFRLNTNITITVATRSGTIANGDYTLAVKSGSATGVSLNGAGGLTYTLTVPATTMSVRLTFTADDTDHEGEVVTLTLSNGSAPATIGTRSVRAIAITDEDVPVPTGLTVGTVTNRSVALSWTSYSGTHTGFKVYYSTSSGFSPPDGTGSSIAADATAVVVNGLTIATDYYFRVAAVNVGTVGTYATAVMAATSAVDYDSDDDGLIDITMLAQLNAIRYDLDGNGAVASTDELNYGVAFPATSGGSAYAAIACGDGTTISTCSGYELMNNLDFNDKNNDGTSDDPSKWSSACSSGCLDGSGAETATTATVGWAPIGDNSNRFTATFDGNGHKISNLYINTSTLSKVGFFGEVGSGGEIHNLGIEGGGISGDGNDVRVGLLVGKSRGEIYACYATGDVTGVGARSPNVGGLVGFNRGKIRACYVTGNVTGDAMGGNGTVAGSPLIGGLVGNNDGTISACYSTGSVTGGNNSTVGGLVGFNAGSSAKIIACYSTGRATGGTSASVGGLVGVNSGTITVSYFDTTTSGKTGTRGKTTTQLQYPMGYLEEDAASGGMAIYSTWNVDVSGTTTTATNEIVWEFGANNRYPKLKVDFDGDGTATMAEFGRQRLYFTNTADVEVFSFSVGESATSGTEIGSVQLLSGVMNSAILSGINHGHFAITVSSGGVQAQITVSSAGAAALSLTSPRYTLQVALTDGAGNTATAAVNITVLDETPPSFTSGGPFTFEVDDGSVAGTAVGSVSARDANTLTYSLTGDGHADFTIDAMGAITVSAAVTLAGSTRLRYNLMVTATDGAGNVATTTVTITVVPDTTMPVFDETTYAFDVDDGSVAGTAVGSVSARDASTLTYSLTGDGHADFTIDAMGQITVSSGVSLSQSRKSTYRLTVTATDAAMNEASAAVTIIVISGLPPSFTFPSGASSFAFDVAENAIVGAVVGTVTATGDVLTYRLRGMNRTDFTIDSVGVVKVSDPSRLDRAAKPSYMLSVTVRDRRDNAITAEVNITVAEIDTTPPRFTFPSGEISFVFGIADGSVAATVVGTITATDDVSSTLTYSLAGNNHTDFTIDAMGAITVSTGVTLSLATRPRYALRVKATDGAGNVSLPANVTITVIDLAVFGVAAEKARVLGLYPNPASDKVYVSGLEPRSRYLYELYSLWGERVSTGQLSEARSIDLEEISVGIYVLVLRSEDGEELLRSRCLVK